MGNEIGVAKVGLQMNGTLRKNFLEFLNGYLVGMKNSPRWRLTNANCESAYAQIWFFHAEWYDSVKITQKAKFSKSDQKDRSRGFCCARDQRKKAEEFRGIAPVLRGGSTSSCYLELAKCKRFRLCPGPVD